MWFVHESLQHSILSADRQVGIVSAVEVKAFIDARLQLQQSNGHPDIYSVIGGVAQIMVTGVLSKEYSYFYGVFGGGSTAYFDIVASIALAEADPEVTDIEVLIASGGGRVDGMLDAIDAITESTKPIKAIVDGMAASAAYAIAAACDSIHCVRKTDLTGSIGVVQMFFVDPDVVEVTNTASPAKRPNVTTAEGLQAVQDELNPVHDLIVEGIALGRSGATGRDITSDIVNADFGKGAVLIATIAQKRGLIDGLVDKPEKVVNNGSTALAQQNKKTNEIIAMDMTQLKKDHRETYDACVAAGVVTGVAQERDRCSAHLIGGQAAGLMDKAVEAVKGGVEMTESLRMEYACGKVNKETAAAGADENVDSGDAGQQQAPEADAATAANKEEAAIANAVAANMSGEGAEF